MKAYIGIAGIMNKSQAFGVADEFPLRASTQRQMFLGYLVSSKTLRGEQNKHPQRFPEVSKLREILPASTIFRNIIHFASKEYESLATNLEQLSFLSGPHLHGFQLNMTWPPASQIGEFRDAHPDLLFVLQLNANAFESVNHDPVALAKQLDAYRETIDGVLIDPSEGLGIAINPNTAISYITAMRDAQLPFNIGVAGGLHGENLQCIVPIRYHYPELSIDAESGLRNGEDRLSIKKAAQYLRTAVDILCHKRGTPLT